MVTVHIVCIGKLKEKYWRDAIEEYAKRLSSYCRFVIQELPEERLPENPSESQIQQCLEKEGDAILPLSKRKNFFPFALRVVLFPQNNWRQKSKAECPREKAICVL